MPGRQLDARRRAVLGAPLRVRLPGVIPRAEAVPDAAGVIARVLAHIDRDREVRLMRDDLPMRARKELPMAEPIEQVPHRVLDGELARPNQSQALLVRLED